MPILHPVRLAGVCAVFVAALALSASAPHAAQTSWTRIDHDALRGGGHVVYVNDILPADGLGNPWLAVGYVVDSDGNREPSAWTSADGVTWRRSKMESTGSSDQRDGPFFVARRGNVAVAVGNRFDGQVRIAAWWSEGASTWSALTTPPDQLLETLGLVEGLTAGPDGFVAVRYHHYESYSVINVFRSSDGRAWHVDGVFSTPVGERFQPLEVSATGGQTVIVGDTASGAGSDGRIWVGKDGYWTKVDPAASGMDGPGLQQVAGIAWDPALGFVAGGLTMRSNTEVPTVWTSNDGVVWQRLLLEGGSAAAIHRVAAVPGGFLASGNSDSGPLLWRSSNARDWSAVATPSAPNEGGVTVSAASDGAKIVLVTTGQYGSQMFRRTGAEWKRADTGPAFPTSARYATELRDVAVASGRVVAVGSDGQGKPLVMVSLKPGAWRKAAFPDGAARFLAVTSDRAGFAIAGWRLVRGRARLAIWTSRNGTSWRRIGGTTVEPVGAFVDIARDSSGLVAAALEPSQRGFVMSVWSRVRGVWRSAPILGPGEAKAVCFGPHGTTAVATRGVGPRARVVAWTRAGEGRWSPEPDIVADGGTAIRCADGPRGTVIAGTNENGVATIWRRMRPGMPWKASFLPATAPATEMLDVVRDGSGYLATGTTGGRGQSDLAVWRSADGVQWTGIGGTEPVFLEPGFQAGLGIVGARGRLVVVGRHGAGNAGLWVGTP